MAVTSVAPLIAFAKLPLLPTWSCAQAGPLKYARITVTYPRRVRINSSDSIYLAIAPAAATVESPTAYIERQINPNSEMQKEMYYENEGYVSVADALLATPKIAGFDPASLQQESISYSDTTSSGVVWMAKAGAMAQETAPQLEFRDHSFDDACKDKDINAESFLTLYTIEIEDEPWYINLKIWFESGLNWLIGLISALITTVLTVLATLWATKKFKQHRRHRG